MRLLIAITSVIAFLILSIGIPMKAAAQDGVGFEGTTLVDAKIDFKGHTVDSRVVKITYAIPYNGMVEFRIWDHEGEKVWQNQYVNEHGKNIIVLKASKFTPGQTYTYAINYKRDEVKNTLIVPPSGFE